MQLRKATRKQAKLRIGLSAASGFGKTYSALLMAYGITGDWSRIAVVDTEHGSAELYSDLGEYNVLALEPPYSPERYIEAIKACEDAGMEVIIVDSISHEWEGKGGCLEIQESLGGRYQDWAKVTPRHQKFIDSILQSSCHVITTVRRKQDYNMIQDGKSTKVEKAGMKEVTREGFEYELTLNFEIVNDRHLVRASKDRTGLYMNRPEFVISEETGRELKQWAESGVNVKDLALAELEACADLQCTVNVWNKYPQLKTDETFKQAVAAKGNSFKQQQAEEPKQEPAPEESPAQSAEPEETIGDVKQRLILLVNNELITRQEKTKLLLNINRMDIEKLRENEEKLINLIAEREDVNSNVNEEAAA